MKLRIILLVLVLITLPIFQQESLAQEIAGTYVLESRVLSDGTIIKPPELMGLYNLEGGHINFNLFAKDKSGSVQSVSYIGKYQFNGSQYSQEILYVTINNQISGMPVSYDFEKKSGTSQVNKSGGNIEFTFPPQNQIKAIFSSGSFKAQRVDGAYTDNWKRVN